MLSELKSEQCGSLDRISACLNYCISPYLLIVLSTGNYFGQQMVTVLCLCFVLFVFSALPGFLSPYNNGSHRYVKSFGLEIDQKPLTFIFYIHIQIQKNFTASLHDYHFICFTIPWQLLCILSTHVFIYLFIRFRFFTLLKNYCTQ